MFRFQMNVECRQSCKSLSTLFVLVSKDDVMPGHQVVVEEIFAVITFGTNMAKVFVQDSVIGFLVLQHLGKAWKGLIAHRTGVGIFLQVVFRGVASQVVELEELLAAAELRTFEVLDLLVDGSDVSLHGVHVAELQRDDVRGAAAD